MLTQYKSQRHHNLYMLSFAQALYGALISKGANVRMMSVCDMYKFPAFGAQYA